MHRLLRPLPLTALLATACGASEPECEPGMCESEPPAGDDTEGSAGGDAGSDGESSEESGEPGTGGTSGGADDGSTGEVPAQCDGPLAQGVSVREATFFQVIAVPAVADGQGVAPDARAVPLVADREAVLRVRVDVGPDFTPRDLALRLDVEGDAGALTEVDIRTIAGSSAGDDPESGFRVDIPAAAMQEDATYVLSIVECDAAPDDAAPDTGVGPRFPTEGTSALAPVTTGPLKIHLVPFEVGGFVPDTSAPVLEGMREAILSVYPVTDVVMTVGDVVPDQADGNLDMGDLLVETGIIQESVDQAPPDVYYYGLVTGARTREEFCDDCPTGTSESGNGSRAAFAIGAAFADQRAEDTLIHELGHMHGLLHAPCGDPDLLDESFPEPDAAIATEGYDFRTDTFVAADHKDLMAYCYPRWIGEYHYAKLVDWVRLAQTWVP